MDTTIGKAKHRKNALLLSLIPGFGQFYNRQFLKGIILFILTVSYVIAFKDLLNIGFWGLFTLGEKVPRDHSIFLLVKGIIALIVAVFGIGIYAFNLVDAYKNGKKRDEGIKLNSVREQYRNLIDNGFPYLMFSPGFILMVFVVIFPIIFVVLLSFTNYNLYHSPPAKLVDWVGIKNYIDMFTMDIWRETFFNVLAWTIVWTFAATTLQIVVGIGLAILVNQKDLKFKPIIRTVFILPWAIPAFVSVLVFAGMFNDTFGTINVDILSHLGIEIPWMTETGWARLALIMIQGWLGFPFIFAMTTGVLQAIPGDLYEAATVDGATAFQKFRKITLPLVLYAIAPILITQYTFNFNNFNVIYLFNGGDPAVSGYQNAGGTDILISWIYRLTMTSAQYGKAAAITMLISLLVIAISLWQFKRTKSFQEEDMM